MQKKTGFTLIELIAVLVITGIVASVAGFMVPKYVNGYLMARDGQSISQKAQTALMRISLELRSLSPLSVTAASSSSITYQRLSNSTTSPAVLSQILALSGNTITLSSNGTVNTLLDNVSSFTLTYYQTGTTPWVLATSPNNTNLLSYIVVNLGVTCSNGAVATFSTAVSLRNNGNAGGEPPPTTTNPPAYKPNCFVATAAFGREDHPVVVTLRDFRDCYLRNWGIGRAFINLYNEIGPHLADAIRNRPWACIAVQLLLFPIAGIVFFVIYLPAGLPVIFILSLGTFHFTKRSLQGCGLRAKTNQPPSACARAARSNTGREVLANDKGSILIAVIVTITVLALLMAAMSTFVPSSTFSQVEGYASRQAYYLAESGYRYAASQFFNAGSGSAVKFRQLSTLNQMNGTSAVKLGANGADGSFALSVTPYFLVYNANYTAGTTSVQLTYPGTSPPSGYNLPSTGSFDVSLSNTPNVVNYTQSGSTYTITTAGGLPTAVQQYNSVRFVTNPSIGQSSITQGGNLTVANAGPFPPYNGSFRVNSGPYSYQYQSKSGDTLQNITNTNPSSPGTGLPLTVASTDNVVCNEFAQVQSTGTANTGITPQTSRTVLYDAQIGFADQSGSSGSSVITTGASGSAGVDTMGSTNLANDTNFSTTGSVGSASYTTSGGNTYLQMNTVNGLTGWLDDVFGSGTWAILPISSTDANNLANGFANGNPHYYETQVKILTGTALPYYLAGINFRAYVSGSSYYGYGLSFAYFPNNPSVSSDGIPDGLIPTDSSGNQVTQKPVILLWESTNSGFQWLAYKVLPSSIVNGTTGIQNWATLLVSLEEATHGSSSKYNQIRAYYGTTGKQGTGPNTIPTDNNSGPNPLSTANWTPLDATSTDWTTSVDNFTLVQWDRVNPNGSSTLAPASDLPTGDTAEAGCVIEDSTFVTSSNEALYNPEILLHVAGSTPGFLSVNSISVGFDDFAIYGPGGASIGFMNPIQQ